eukprot:gnl/TRDRNA2_/TRDRNA2_174525_c1_seq2.p1 gnl/TRDRNA2_/TRDRNA2_174525_c1~~gnl/TRDRNA2_/TRDRNA2_174525_c1_seq2.p1  ORF type:complete len:112 (+),score=10.67 gnl/TRDRNA2_/TRDRNA2_174525_c1_seq2:377-712(+)
MSLFAVLARVVEWRIGDFSARHLANAAWAFEAGAHSDASLFAALAGAVRGRAVHCIGEFNTPDLDMIVCSLPRCGRLHVTWALLDQAREIHKASSAICFGALLMECEQASV